MTSQTLNTPPAESASAALKHATAAEHRRAEQSPFQRLLVSGRIPLIPTLTGWTSSGGSTGPSKRLCNPGIRRLAIS
jgi:hypothetical protein